MKHRTSFGEATCLGCLQSVWKFIDHLVCISKRTCPIYQVNTKVVRGVANPVWMRYCCKKIHHQDQRTVQISSKITMAEEPLRSTIASLEAELRSERHAVSEGKQGRKQDEEAFKQQLRNLEDAVQELRLEAASLHAEKSKFASLFATVHPCSL